MTNCQLPTDPEHMSLSSGRAAATNVLPLVGTVLVLASGRSTPCSHFINSCTELGLHLVYAWTTPGLHMKNGGRLPDMCTMSEDSLHTL